MWQIILSTSEVASVYMRLSQHTKALDALQNIFSRPEIFAELGILWGHGAPKATEAPPSGGFANHNASPNRQEEGIGAANAGNSEPAPSTIQLDDATALCTVLTTLGDVYVSLHGALDHARPAETTTDDLEELFPKPDRPISLAGTLHLAAMAPFSTLDRSTCLDLAISNFQAASAGLERKLAAAAHQPLTGSGRAGDGPAAAGALQRSQKLLAAVVCKLGNACNEVGKHQLEAAAAPASVGGGGDSGLQHLMAAEAAFGLGLNAFRKCFDVENVALLTINLAAVRRRLAFEAQQVTGKVRMTLAHRTDYAAIIGLYENALSVLGSRRQQRQRQAGSQDPKKAHLDPSQIRRMVQVELGGLCVAFAQQLQHGCQIIHPGIDQQLQSTGVLTGSPSGSQPEGASRQKRPKGELDGSESIGTGSEQDTDEEYVVDGLVGPDLLRKALELYGPRADRGTMDGVGMGRAAELDQRRATAHRELGVHHTAEIATAADRWLAKSLDCGGTVLPTGEHSAAALALRKWGRARFDRALGHLEKALHLVCFSCPEGSAPGARAAAARFAGVTCLDICKLQTLMAAAPMVAVDGGRPALEAALAAAVQMGSGPVLAELPCAASDGAIWAAALCAARQALKELVSTLARAQGGAKTAASGVELAALLARYKVLYRQALLASDDDAFDAVFQLNESLHSDVILFSAGIQ